MHSGCAWVPAHTLHAEPDACRAQAALGARASRRPAAAAARRQRRARRVPGPGQSPGCPDRRRTQPLGPGLPAGGRPARLAAGRAAVGGRRASHSSADATSSAFGGDLGFSFASVCAAVQAAPAFRRLSGEAVAARSAGTVRVQTQRRTSRCRARPGGTAHALGEVQALTPLVLGPLGDLRMQTSSAQLEPAASRRQALQARLKCAALFATQRLVEEEHSWLPRAAHAFTDSAPRGQSFCRTWPHLRRTTPRLDQISNAQRAPSTGRRGRACM